MKKIVCVAVSLLVLISVLGATTPEEKLAEGIAYHDSARIDPANNIEKGKEILSSLQQDMPLAKAYYGSLITIEAGVYAKKNNGIKALTLLSEGTKLMDAAVSEAPNLPDIHFLRMINSYDVSEASPVNRYKVMKSDIDWLEGRVSKYDAKWQGTFQLYKGLYNIKARKRDVAMAAFDACILVSPDSIEAAEAIKMKARYAE